MHIQALNRDDDISARGDLCKVHDYDGKIVYLKIINGTIMMETMLIQTLQPFFRFIRFNNKTMLFGICI